MKDIKYSGIPNVCFSLTHKDDKREKKFLKQRRKRGFDDSETWSLVNTIASFSIPRLERYIELSSKILIRTDEEWADINSILVAFKLIDRDKGSWTFTPEEEVLLNKGLDAFPKMFMRLWW